MAAAGSEDGGAAPTAVWPGGEQLLLLSAKGVGRSTVRSSHDDPAPKPLHYGLTLSVPDPQPPHLYTATMSASKRRKAGDWALSYEGPGGHLCAWDDLRAFHLHHHRRMGKGHGCASPSSGGASVAETAVHVVVAIILAPTDRLSRADSSCDLNVGKWNGIFYQFDAHGRVQQEISTRLSASTYGEGDLISLMQLLYIKQASCGIPFADENDPEPEWVEYKIIGTNMFTVDKYQQCTDRVLS